jgi:TRAP-type C4-dicarboxylate transport system substrate-binding protein
MIKTFGGVTMKNFYSVFFIIIGLTLALGVNSLPTYAAEQVTTLKFSCQFPAVHKVALLKVEWGKEVEKRTNGKVKVEVYPGAVLTPPAQTYDSVKKGIAHVGETFASYTSGRFPLTEAVDLPLGYKSALQGTRLANAFYKQFKPKEFDDVQVMFFHTAAPQIVCTKTPVYKLEDLKGMKIRSTGTSSQIVQALGAAPVAMSMGEAYDALSRGVVNGVVGPVEVIKGWKLGEVVNNCTSYGSAHVNAAFVIMNKGKWNTFPKDIQKIIEQVNEEFAEKQGKLWDELDKEGEDLLIKQGGKLIKLSKEEDARWKAAVKPLLDDYVKNSKAKGLPGDEALKFVQDFVAKN